ncbi:hypothetical protein AU476_01360 [Cupriavidus sp. UYMSc13B]|nr:hypothetical protein AU476_01360 [Cupriavidus sp. UYMSc13B]
MPVHSVWIDLAIRTQADGPHTPCEAFDKMFSDMHLAAFDSLLQEKYSISQVLDFFFCVNAFSHISPPPPGVHRRERA